MKRIRPLRLTLCLLAWLAACATPTVPGTTSTESPALNPTTEVSMSLELTSSAFGPGGPIPAIYSCQGQGISPALMWSNIPPGAQSLALIVDDPDAPSAPVGCQTVFVSRKAVRRSVPGVRV